MMDEDVVPSPSMPPLEKKENSANATSQSLPPMTSSRRNDIIDKTLKASKQRKRLSKVSLRLVFSFLITHEIDCFLQIGGVIQWAVGSQNGLLYLPKVVPSETREARKDMFLSILRHRIAFSSTYPSAWPPSAVPIQLVSTDSCVESTNALNDAYDELKIKFENGNPYGKSNPCKFAYDHFHALQHIIANSGAHWDRFIAQKDFSFILGLVKSPFHGDSCFGLKWEDDLEEQFGKSENINLFEQLLVGKKNLTNQKLPRIVALRHLVMRAGEMVQWFVLPSHSQEAFF